MENTTELKNIELEDKKKIVNQYLTNYIEKYRGKNNDPILKVVEFLKAELLFISF